MEFSPTFEPMRIKVKNIVFIIKYKHWLLVQVLWNGKNAQIVAIGKKSEKRGIKTLKSLDFSRDFDVWCQIGNNRWRLKQDSNL